MKKASSAESARGFHSNLKGNSMKIFFSKLTLVLVLPLIAIFSSASIFGVATHPTKSPLGRLIEGNQRYISSSTVCHDDWSAKRMAQVEGQAPFAVILTCSDSRVPPEIIFDQALGSLFVIRIAGNVVDDFAIGSIEYGVTVLGANLVLVLGHSNCGAVEGALKGLTFDNHIQEVLNVIKPAVENMKGEKENVLEKAIKENAILVVRKLKNSRPVLAKLFQQGKISILGAYYDLASGKVEFLGQP